MLNANRFSVAELDGDRVIGIEEKQDVPKSDYAVTGLYMYDAYVSDVIKELKPSGRGELEITDVNNYYIDKGQKVYKVLDGYWSDAGTFESLLRASVMVQKYREKKEGTSDEPQLHTDNSRYGWLPPGFPGGQLVQGRWV